MTADQAADILDITENTVRGYAREGLIRTDPVWTNRYSGVDVQRLRRLRMKHGVRRGMWMARQRLATLARRSRG